MRQGHLGPSSAQVCIQARYNSTRLPGKVLLKIGAHAVLEHIGLRTEAAGYPVNFLTPWNGDGQLGQCDWEGQIAEGDVLGRFARWVAAHPTDYIVRITADCPFIDPDLIRDVTERTMELGYEYGDNIATRSYPRGLDVQVYRRDYLLWLHKTAQTPEDREHVLPRIREPGYHSRYCKVRPEGMANHHRWCLDTREDYLWFETIAKHLNCAPPHPTTAELLAFLEAHPEYVHTDDSAAA